MNVKQVIERLEKCDPLAKVIITDCSHLVEAVQIRVEDKARVYEGVRQSGYTRVGIDVILS